MEAAKFCSLIKPGMIVFDVGGNIGQYTLLAAKRVGVNGTVFTFEPYSGNYEIIERCIAGNGFADRVRLHKLALTSHLGAAELIIASDGGSCHLALAGGGHDGLTEKVECTTLDDFASSNNVERVDLIKIDAEGADFDILMGGERTLREFKPQLFVEFSERTLAKFGTSPEAMLGFLRGLGYKAWTFTRTGLAPLSATDDIGNRNLFLAPKEE